jgi:hypothetical protein
MDWESWLRTAADPPSDNEDQKRDRTEQEIKEALRAYEPLKGRPYVVYAKGSYANNTNVRLNYDVDVAVEYNGFFFSELAFDLKGKDQSTVGIVDSSDPYSTDDFKRDIKEALVKAFGSEAVDEGRIAYRVREKKTTLPADVVPCWEYRRYDRISWGVPVCHIGSRVFPSSGGHIDNFPKIQLTKGKNKNTDTGHRYKYMVRALKKLQTKLVNDGLLEEELPSYLIECLVYNVENARFGHSKYIFDMREVLATIFNATLSNGNSSEWHEVHELHYLFHGDRKWTVAQVHHLADVAWDFLGLD